MYQYVQNPRKQLRITMRSEFVTTWILKVRARMKAQPKTEIIPMLERMARGPFLSAFLVSSVKCAAASYPYREYWLTSQDKRTLYTGLLMPVASDDIWSLVKTYEALWVLGATKGTMITIRVPPTTWDEGQKYQNLSWFLKLRQAALPMHM